MQASTPLTSRLPLLAVLLWTGCFDPAAEEFPMGTSTGMTGDGSTSTPPPLDTDGSTGPGQTTAPVDDTTAPPGDTSSSSDDDTTAGVDTGGSSGSSDSGDASGSSDDATTGVPGCGNGIVEGAELCDDGNAIELDGCTNACAPGSIHVAGTAITYLVEAMVALGEAHTSEPVEWPAADAAGVIVIGHDGASVAAPNYQAHLDAGGHVLLVGGSGDPAYAAWASAFVANTGEGNWHMSDSCVSDWNTAGAHPMTALLPASYEFTEQAVSFHMLHFTAAGQPADTELLGQSCEPGPNNYVLATRRYASGGTFTYMALDLGPYSDAASGPMFVQPFLQGYLDYVRSPAP